MAGRTIKSQSEAIKKILGEISMQQAGVRLDNDDVETILNRLSAYENLTEDDILKDGSEAYKAATQVVSEYLDEHKRSAAQVPKEHLFAVGDEIGYHGRSGVVKSYENGGYIVYFKDVDKEQWIDANELFQQDMGSRNAQEAYTGPSEFPVEPGVIAYHEMPENKYFFMYGDKRVDLDWGETGFVPEKGDVFESKMLGKKFRLEDLVSNQAAAMLKEAYIKRNPGHKDSKGQLAEWCFTKNTKVLTVEGFVKISQLKAGDKIRSYNTVTGKFVITTVKQALVREVSVDEVIRLKIGFDNIHFVTREHTFLAADGKGWISAQEIKSKELFHVTKADYSRFSAERSSNPFRSSSFHQRVRDKRIATWKKHYREGKISAPTTRFKNKYPERYEHHCKARSKALKENPLMWNNELKEKRSKTIAKRYPNGLPSPMLRLDVVKKVFASRSDLPSSLEKKVINIIQEYKIPIQYIGDGKVWLDLLDGHRMNPDFCVTGQDKFIEVFDPADPLRREKEYCKKRKSQYKQIDKQVLMLPIHIHTKKDYVNKKQQVVLQLRQFVNNGIKAEASQPRFKGVYNKQLGIRNGKVDVYNIEVDYPHNFIIKGGVIAHNCIHKHGTGKRLKCYASEAKAKKGLKQMRHWKHAQLADEAIKDNIVTLLKNMSNNKLLEIAKEKGFGGELDLRLNVRDQIADQVIGFWEDWTVDGLEYLKKKLGGVEEMKWKTETERVGQIEESPKSIAGKFWNAVVTDHKKNRDLLIDLASKHPILNYLRKEFNMGPTHKDVKKVLEFLEFSGDEELISLLTKGSMLSTEEIDEQTKEAQVESKPVVEITEYTDIFNPMDATFAEANGTVKYQDNEISFIAKLQDDGQWTVEGIDDYRGATLSDEERNYLKSEVIKVVGHYTPAMKKKFVARLEKSDTRSNDKWVVKGLDGNDLFSVSLDQAYGLLEGKEEDKIKNAEHFTSSEYGSILSSAIESDGYSKTIDNAYDNGKYITFTELGKKIYDKHKKAQGPTTPPPPDMTPKPDEELVWEPKGQNWVIRKKKMATREAAGINVWRHYNDRETGNQITLMSGSSTGANYLVEESSPGKEDIDAQFSSDNSDQAYEYFESRVQDREKYPNYSKEAETPRENLARYPRSFGSRKEKGYSRIIDEPATNKGPGSGAYRVDDRSWDKKIKEAEGNINGLESLLGLAQQVNDETSYNKIYKKIQDIKKYKLHELIASFNKGAQIDGPPKTPTPERAIWEAFKAYVRKELKLDPVVEEKVTNTATLDELKQILEDATNNQKIVLNLLEDFIKQANKKEAQGDHQKTDQRVQTPNLEGTTNENTKDKKEIDEKAEAPKEEEVKREPEEIPLANIDQEVQDKLLEGEKPVRPMSEILTDLISPFLAAAEEYTVDTVLDELSSLFTDTQELGIFRGKLEEKVQETKQRIGEEPAISGEELMKLKTENEAMRETIDNLKKELSGAALDSEEGKEELQKKETELVETKAKLKASIDERTHVLRLPRAKKLASLLVEVGLETEDKTHELTELTDDQFKAKEIEALKIKAKLDEEINKREARIKEETPVMNIENVMDFVPGTNFNEEKGEVTAGALRTASSNDKIKGFWTRPPLLTEDEK